MKAHGLISYIPPITSVFSGRSFSEKVFSFSILFYAFAIFSCLFPTGFISVSSTAAITTAIFIGIRNKKEVLSNLNKFEKSGLALLGWLAISTTWSDSFVSSLYYLFEYRIFLFLPFVGFALYRIQGLTIWVIIFVVAGSIVALIMSYLLAFNLIEIEGARLSLANRIFHAFVMSIFFSVIAIIFLKICINLNIRKANTSDIVVFLAVSMLGVLTFINLVGIEVGRTGYFQIFSVLAFLLAVKMKSVYRAVFFIIVIFYLFYSSIPVFEERIQLSVNNLISAVSGQNSNSSVGFRFEFYKAALDIIIENPIFGVGIGNAESTLAQKFVGGGLAVFTNNIHSEVLSMGVYGGITSILLFSYFVYSIFIFGTQFWREHNWLSLFIICLAIVILFSVLFNSSFKDFGEKHVMILVLGLISALGRECSKVTLDPSQKLNSTVVNNSGGA